MSTNVYIAIYFPPGKAPSYYKIDETEELLETVDVLADGSPDWDAGGIVEPGRFADIEQLSQATYLLAKTVRDYCQRGHEEEKEVR